MRHKEKLKLYSAGMGVSPLNRYNFKHVIDESSIEESFKYLYNDSKDLKTAFDKLMKMYDITSIDELTIKTCHLIVNGDKAMYIRFKELGNCTLCLGSVICIPRIIAGCIYRIIDREIFSDTDVRLFTFAKHYNELTYYINYIKNCEDVIEIPYVIREIIPIVDQIDVDKIIDSNIIHKTFSSQSMCILEKTYNRGYYLKKEDLYSLCSDWKDDLNYIKYIIDKIEYRLEIEINNLKKLYNTDLEEIVRNV